MKKINQLKAGTILTYINLGLGTVIPLLYTPIMLRILGQSEYGVNSLATSITGYLTILNLGMGKAIIRYITKYRAEGNKKGVESMLGLFIVIYSALAGLVCVVGGFLTVFADSFFGKGLTSSEISILEVLMILMTINTALSFIVSVFSSVSISFERYIFGRTLDIISTMLTPIFNLCVLFMGLGSIGMAAVGVALQTVYLGIYILYSRKKLDLKPRFSKLPSHLIKELWGFSMFIFLSSIVDMLYWATDKVLIGAMVGSVAVAVYNVGGTFTTMLQNMSGAISNVFVPRVTTMVVTNSGDEDLSALLTRIGRLQYIIVSLFLSGYIVFGKTFIYYWAGDGYEDAYYIALLTMIPLAIPLIQNIAYNIIVAQNKHQFRAIIYTVIAVVNVVSTYLVLPHYGIIGAAVCTSIAFLVGNGVIMNIYYYKVTKLDIPGFWRNIGKMSIVPVFMGVIGYAVVNHREISLSLFMAGVIIYVLVFAVLIWLISFNSYEKALFTDLIKKIFVFLPIRRKGE